MTHQVTNLKSGNTFTVSDTTVLQAALDAGLNYPYGCRNGFCGRCKAHIAGGKIHYKGDIPPGIREDELADFALLCQCFADSDLEINIDELVPEVRVSTFAAQITEVVMLNHDVVKLVLTTETAVKYLSGQYVDIGYSSAEHTFEPRAFSIANQSGSNTLEFHIRVIAGGEFTTFLAQHLPVGEQVEVTGPKGDFYLRNTNDKDIILVAGGTGLAPVKAILEELKANDDPRNITLYWGVRDMGDIYFDFTTLAGSENITYIPVLSQPSADWKGRTGYVHSALLEDITDFGNYAVYTCGPPVMVEAVATACSEHGLSKQNFYNDSFEFNTITN